MASWSDKINWMAEAKSYAAIARESGIPYRTILSVKAGAEMPPSFTPDANSYYRSESYRRMRAEGVPTVFANQSRGGSLETIVEATDIISRKVTEWTIGAMYSKYRGSIDNIPKAELDAFKANISEKIKQSLSSSSKTPRQIDESNIS